jgi:hypothetical protein
MMIQRNIEIKPCGKDVNKNKGYILIFQIFLKKNFSGNSLIGCSALHLIK